MHASVKLGQTLFEDEEKFDHYMKGVMGTIISSPLSVQTNITVPNRIIVQSRSLNV
jgi:hypothetical protein